MNRTETEFWTRLRQGTVLIVGLSERTGLPAARLFDAHGVRYKVSDHASREELGPRLAQIRVADKDVFSGPQRPEQLDGITEVLIAPGVPRSIPLVREARRRGLPVRVDLDLIYELMASKHIVAISGTDGKTTTTSLTGALLQSIGSVLVAGNIGVSVLAKVDELAACDWLVLEVSSFMLEQVERFRPNIAALLNIAEDHIDRYASLDEYAAVKFNIVRHCRPQDVLVLNVDDPRLARARPNHVTVRTVSRQGAPADSTYADGWFQVGGARFAYAGCQLAGLANIDNILTAATIAHEAGVAPEHLVGTLRRFRGLPHRFECLGTFAGVRVYEDSKATNVHAVEAALLNFQRSVVLILGGRSKGLDFRSLRAHRHRVHRLVCYGESGEQIRDAIELPGALYAYRFGDAVRLAAAQCRPGDVLLLSPGCTSWDQFRDYEARGDAFRRLLPSCFSARPDVEGLVGNAAGASTTASTNESGELL
ncbi:MAG: UDP-N-acetylmuramoyl-L-alanine--D-glutamate ligase [Polyangiaceae bacterium]|nr:UDP-N-acetylmuramoyl-L-alanine--D-glutamate ligase [Polyangiaceae bacterium]